MYDLGSGPPKALDEDDVTFLAEYDLTKQRARLEREMAEREELARFEAERARLVYTAQESVILPAPTASSPSSISSPPPSSSTSSSSASASIKTKPGITQKKKTGLLGVSVIQVAPKRKQPEAATSNSNAGSESKSPTKTKRTDERGDEDTHKKQKHSQEEKPKERPTDDSEESDDEGGGLKLVDY